MDMDIDIDIDELELLEANSRFHEDQLDPTSPDPYPYAPEDEPHHSSPQINGQKRSRSDDSDSPNLENAVPSDEKRNKIYHDVEPEAVEDCLRFSPPRKENVREEVEEVVVAEQQEKYLSRYASRIDGDFIPVTAPSGGDRVYAKISRVEKNVRSKKLDVKTHSNSLTYEPINVLLQRVEQEAFNKALQESTGFQSDAVLPETQVVHEQLWVDKYSPNSFTELLSDESTNREVLLWFKQWDSCVFGSEIRNTSEEVLSALKRHSSSSQHPKPSDSISLGKRGGHTWSNRNFRTSNTFDRENITMKGVQDSWSKKSRPIGPPEQKILLLCGPPGLGKTTLAHVAAKHCGYHVVEVNASDDRSSSSIEAKILDVVQMNSVMADSKPKCLVIDEIDGALGDGKGAAEVILKMVSAEKKSANEKENTDHGDQSGRMTSKKRRKSASLSRPIICICNDLYVPALRQLRQVAKVHVFVQPTVSRVVNRLKYICGKEGMKTSSIALTALAEYTECDVRSCLNTLQFLNKKKEDLNVLNISSQVIGRKDISRSVFDVWKEIFQKRKVKQERKYNSKCDGMSTGSDSLPSLVSNRGDYDVILDGIHENILQLHYHDPMMHKTVKCINSLGISDLFHQYIMRTQQMPLLAYQPTVVITIHGLVAQIQRPTIEWPKSHQRYRAIMMEKMEMFRSWRNTISPCISRHLSIKSFVEDSVSPLLHIFSPPALRPVPMHLLSEKDKSVLTQLVSKMVSYSVSYKNKKPTPISFNQEHEAALDSSSLFFDPAISDFIIFKGYTSGHYVLPLAVKQVLVHEIEKEKILQVSKSAHLKDGCNKESVALVSAKNSEAHQTNVDHASLSSVNNEGGRDISNPIQRIPIVPTASSKFNSTRSTVPNVELKSSRNPKKHSTVSIDFFARFRKVANTGSQHTDSAIQRKTTSERDSRPVLFKYNEGFTNAVKRPVRMRDFLL